MRMVRRFMTLVSAAVAGAALLAMAGVQDGIRLHPASKLTRAVSAERPPDADGFIQRWLVLEPIAIKIRSNAQLNDSFVQATIKTDYFSNQYNVIPRHGDKATVNGSDLTWHAVDSNSYHINLYHFARSLNKQAFNVLFWAVAIVNCPEEMRNVRLAVGSNAASIWWINGTEVIGIYGDRHMVVDDGVSKRLSLRKGPNIVRCAVVNSPGVSDICARFLDSADKPVKKWTSILSP